MNTTSDHRPDPSAEEAAALWAARLDGSELALEDRRELEAWLEADASHRQLLSAYCQFSADLEQRLPLLEGIRESSSETPRELTSARPSPRSSRPLWVGAMLTAAAAVALVFWFARAPRAETRELATAAAQRQTIALADGSRLELNAHTRLAVTLAPDERRVHLTSGQAFFTVAKDPQRPFFVETSAGVVRVTGTQFDVRADELVKFQVTVREGSVQVQPAGTAAVAPFALKASDQYLAGEVRALDAGDLDAALAWRNGEIVFRGAPLSDVLAAFARHHDREIAVSPAARQLRLGGRFNLDNLDQFLELLPQALDRVTVKRDAHGSVQVQLRDER